MKRAFAFFAMLGAASAWWATARSNRRMRATMRRRLRFVATSAIAIALVGWVGSSTASATPTNDDFVNATVINSVPFHETVNVAGTTLEPGEPTPCGSGVLGTVWYSFTPSITQIIEADNFGGIGGDMNVYAQTGAGFLGLSPVHCSGYNPVVFTAQAGTTYFFQTDIPFFTSSGDLVVNVTAPPTPANDNFASATPAVELPLYVGVDTTGASTEAGEPSPSCAFNSTGSVWYSFTPSANQTVEAFTQSFFGSSAIAVYTGTSLSNLTELGSSCFGGPAWVQLHANTTYYFQVVGTYGAQGSITVYVYPAPLPVVNFFANPSFEPAPGEVITFQNSSYDLAGFALGPASWDFGDGTTLTTTDMFVTHQYAKDGDYTVTLRMTTTDGRTGTAQQVFNVATHDVAVSQLSVPMAAKSGQTKPISVTVRNSGDSAEQIWLNLYVATGGGFQLIRQVTPTVSANGPKHPTTFSFNYRFTASDATVGKVVFKAEVILPNHRDLFPGDNVLVSPAVKVS